MASNKIVLIALGVLLLPLLGAGIFFLSQKWHSSPTPTPTLQETSVTGSPTILPTGSPLSTKSPTPTPIPTSTPSPTLAPITKTINSTASLDGFESSNGGGNTVVDIRAGRNVNLVTRGFVGFDLGGIPTGVTIEKATLRLYQTSTVGNPYGVGGNLKVDHLDYGGSLENADYSASSISSSFATLTGNSTVEWKDVDVTDQVKTDLSGSRTRSEFRLHFATETQGGDVTGDFAYFESAENYVGTGNTPQLVVKYH